MHLHGAALHVSVLLLLLPPPPLLLVLAAMVDSQLRAAAAAAPSEPAATHSQGCATVLPLGATIVCV